MATIPTLTVTATHKLIRIGSKYGLYMTVNIADTTADILVCDPENGEPVLFDTETKALEIMEELRA